MQSASKLSTTCRSVSCRPLFARLSLSNILAWTPPAARPQNLLRLLPERRSLLTTMATAAPAPGAAAPATAAPPADPKLVKLRELMAAAGIDAFIIPSEDPHMSEYPPDCDARRTYISNFDGSAGTAVVTATAAALWTDGRYFLQAETQLGPDWTLMRSGTPKVPEIPEWLVTTLPVGGRVGIDPTLHTIEAAEKLRRQLAAAGRALVPLPSNPIDAVWGADRPPAPTAAVRVHALEWAGKSVAEKLEECRKEMAAAGAGALAVTMLDEVAWLVNLRGGDVPYNPVFLSYALVTADSATLFVDPAKIGTDAAAHLAEAGVTVAPYDAAFDAVRQLASAGVKIWMDPARASLAMKAAAIKAACGGTASGANGDGPPAKRPRAEGDTSNNAAEQKKVESSKNTDVVLEKASPVTAAKAVKNEAELAGMREAHVRDGVALVKFFCWLEKTIAGGASLTECQIDEELTARRAAQPGFFEPSFPTIAGAGPNGAIIHYRPVPETCASVSAGTLLLLDSGGQYDCGTTDITRTMHMGEPTPAQRAAYTAVLQGHIALDTAVWPEGTPGCALDTLARTALWRLGLNYRHGTGHGVGAALNVHEGPQSISARYWNTQPLLKDMVCSNEPGFYADGEFGIRIENLMIIVPAETPNKFAGEYYTCDPITVCPIQKKMIDTDAVSPVEVKWLDSYHQMVYDTLAPRLEAEGAAEELAWLKAACAPLL